MDNNTTEAPSKASSFTLQDLDGNKPENPSIPQQYVYIEKRTPNPDAKPKSKSKIGKFLSKFQSPAVKATTAIHERAKLEQERTGIRKTQATDVARSSNAWALS